MRKTLIALLATTTLAACASTRMSDADRLALYSAHAGPPVSNIRYTNPIGWEKIDDEHIVLSMRPKEHYLLTVNGPCLEWGASAPAININHRTPMLLSAKFDSIDVAGTPASCRIEEIRPIDMVAVREDRNAMRASVD